MSETITSEARREALNEFAATAMPISSDMLPAPVVNNAMPAIVGSQQIAGERRDVRRVMGEIKELAAAAGTAWFYRFPVRNKRENRIDYIEGPSIKLAMAVMGIVGNIEVDTRVQDFGSTFMIYARAVDLEKGSAVTRAFQQNKSAAKIGGADDGRRNDMALQIGQSKAIRNVICALLEFYTDFAFEEAQNSLVERIGRDVVKWRDRVISAKIEGKVDLKRVEAIIGRTAEKWLAPDIARIIAMTQAVEDGMASMDETFPPLGAVAESASEGTEAKLDTFAGEGVKHADASGPAGEQTAAPAPPQGSPPEVEQAAVDVRPEIADKLLKLATNTRQSPQERLEALQLYNDSAFDAVPPPLHDFLKACIDTAAKVIRDEVDAAQARKYLRGLIK